MNLDDIKFIKLLPKFMQEDGCDQGIADALDDLHLTKNSLMS